MPHKRLEPLVRARNETPNNLPASLYRGKYLLSGGICDSINQYKMKIRTEKLVDVDEWDKLVQDTYGRPYNFQQQSGCQDRGTFPLTVPAKADDYKNDEIPEVVNGKEMGVSFKAWLARDPKTVMANQPSYCAELFWGRNFYPDIQMIANDLHDKGLLRAGKYIINIDW